MYTLKPMLAKPIDYGNRNIKKAISGHLLFEPKLDGIRATAQYDKETDQVVLMSRQLKTFKGHALDNIKQELLDIYHNNIASENEILDGELYMDGLDFNTIQSIVTDWKSPYDANVQCNYHIYDLFDTSNKSLTCINRKQRIKKICENAKMLVPVEYLPWDVYCADLATMQQVIQEFHNSFVNQGYEGLIIRTQEGVYQEGKRPNDLLKVKAFKDEEFEIIDINEGKGKFVGIPVFTFKIKDEDIVNPKNTTFTGVLIGSESYRKAIYDKKEDYIGLKATVKFFEKSEENIPRFPTVIAIRDYE